MAPGALRRYASPAIVAFAGIALSICVFMGVMAWERQRLAASFKISVENRYAELEREVDSSLNVLLSMQAFMDVHQEQDRTQFRSFASHLVSPRRGVQALEWIPRVPHNRRKSYERKARGEGFSEFRITERTGTGTLVEAERREEYFPVYFAEPVRGNEKALGFDLASNQERREALERSRDSGSMVASKRMRLVQETGDQSGFLVFAPVYDGGGIPNSTDERRRRLAGFALGVFRIGDIVENSLAHVPLEGIGTYFHDQSAPEKEQFLYHHRPRKGGAKKRTAQGTGPQDTDLRIVKTLDVAGRSWLIAFHATPSFNVSMRTWQPWGALLLGLLLTGLLTAYLAVTIRRNAELAALNDLLKREMEDRARATRERARLESQLVQAQKMEAVGQLAAGVAHEINNPTGFVMSNLKSLERYTGKLSEFVNVQSRAIEALSTASGDGEGKRLAEEAAGLRKSLKIDFVLDDMADLVAESYEGAQRIKTTVMDLKAFSRADEGEYRQADINAVIESSVNLIWNELKYKTTVKKELGDIPLTKCNPGQLGQVFVNLMINAVQAIETDGEIAIRTWSDGADIRISVTDTGGGIPEDKIHRIFEPFFTTKEVGQGTGLGLSISYDIVRKHNGDISVQSEPGKGATFTIRLPVQNVAE